VSEKSTSPLIEFREVLLTDYNEIARIYNYYILNSTNTFHQKPFLPEEIPNLIPINHPKYKSYGIIEQQKLIGFCAIKAFSPRESYARTAEVVLYLDPQMVFKGIGSIVFKFCETMAKNAGFKVLISSISGENKASIHLCEKCGFVQCGVFKQVGEKFGHILDVVFLQKFI